MNALFLIGSAKPKRSTSGAYGKYLARKLEERGMETETLVIHKTVRKEEGRQKLVEAVERADVIVLSFPLYVDCLPALVIKTLDIIAEWRKAAESPRAQRFFAITNCGFPEPHHCDTALAICQRFTRETGMGWIGGIAMGAGQVIDGVPLHKLGFLTRHVRKSLDLAAVSLADDELLSKDAIRLMAKPLFPAWLYNLAAKHRWKSNSKKFGVWEHIHDRPYEK